MEEHAVPDKENGGEEVKQHLLNKLLGSGLLNSVKAHLRAKLFAELKGRDLNFVLAAPASPTLQQHVLNCLVTEYLLAVGYKYSLSVFLSESGTHKLPQLSHADLLRLVGVAQGSRVHQLLVARAAGGCLATGMVEALAHIEACAAPTASVACQTEEQPAASVHLLARLATIEEEFRQRSARVEAQSASFLEGKVAECQRECEARYEAQLQAAVVRMRETELGTAREAEAAKCAQQLATDRQALHRSYQERLDRLRAQEEELMEKTRKAQRALDQLREEHEQRLRGQEERLRGWKEQEEAMLAAKEAETRRRLEQADRQERMALERQREVEQKLQDQQQALKHEMQRREEDLRRQQAALDLEREQLGRSRADMAAPAAEAELLRRQLASQADAHFKEKSYLQQDMERLRSQLQLLQDELAQSRQRRSEDAKQTAAVEASDNQRQAAERAQHSLQQQRARESQLQEELVASRGRERLWRESAGTSERLLVKASKWHEQCLQHVEELRLALASAVREVADLQQQAQLVAAEASGPLARALTSAISDAQKWRDAILSRLDAASQEEARLRQELSRIQQRAAASRLDAAQALQGLLATYVHSRHGRRAAASEPLEDAAAATAVVFVAAGEEGGMLHGPGRGLPGKFAAPMHGGDSFADGPRAASPGSQLAEESSSDDGSSTPSEGSHRSQSCSPAPASRTTSHILAAYRARQEQQQQAAASQAASAANTPRHAELSSPLGLADEGPSRMSSSSPGQAAGARQSSPLGAPCMDAAAPAGQPLRPGGTVNFAQQKAPSVGDNDIEDYYVSSEDSKF